jgi:hypothetical protein
MIAELRKLVTDGATIQEFGTRLYIWYNGQAFATRHITDAEYVDVKKSGLLGGVREPRQGGF